MRALRMQATGREPLLGIVIVLVFLLVGLKSSNFATSDNLVAILTDTATIGIIAIGAGLVIIGGGIDISVGSTLAASATVAGLIAQDGQGTTAGRRGRHRRRRGARRPSTPSSSSA